MGIHEFGMRILGIPDENMQKNDSQTKERLLNNDLLLGSLVEPAMWCRDPRDVLCHSDAAEDRNSGDHEWVCVVFVALCNKTVKRTCARFTRKQETWTPPKKIGHIPLIYVLLTKKIEINRVLAVWNVIQQNRSSIQSRRCFCFFALWFVPQPVSPSCANFVIISLRICTASKDTIATGWKDFALMSFFEGGSTMLLIEGTQANQVKVCTSASCSAK